MYQLCRHTIIMVSQGKIQKYTGILYHYYVTSAEEEHNKVLKNNLNLTSICIERCLRHFPDRWHCRGGSTFLEWLECQNVFSNRVVTLCGGLDGEWPQGRILVNPPSASSVENKKGRPLHGSANIFFFKLYSMQYAYFSKSTRVDLLDTQFRKQKPSCVNHAGQVMHFVWTFIVQ